MPEPVNIPFAVAEYTSRFEQTNFRFFSDPARLALVERMAHAWLPYKLRAQNTEVTVGTLAEQKLTFRLPELKITIQTNSDEFKFTKEMADWYGAEETLKILADSEKAVLHDQTIKIASQQVSIATHLQPMTKSREEILKPFIPAPFHPHIAERQLTSFGNHLKFANSDVLLDFSAGIANGIFVRFSTLSEGHLPLTDIFAKVREEQLGIYKVLDVEEAEDHA